MYQLTKCCCCIPLSIGTLIIGVLYLIGSVISLAGLLMVFVQLFNIRRLIGSGEHHYSKEYILLMLNAGPALIIAAKVICIVMVVLCVLHIGIDVLLIFGAATHRAKLALPWLVLNLVLLILNLAILGVISILGFLYMQTTVNTVSISPIVLASIYLAVTVYSMLVVSNFYENSKKIFEY